MIEVVNGQDQQNLDEEMEETELKNPPLRSLNEIEELLQMAKVNRSDLTNDIQVLRFADVVSSENSFLLEISPSMLQSIENGSSLTIRGEKTDKAVLCSDCETFEIKEVECSNTTFLAKDLRIPSKKELHARTDFPNLSVATISSVFQSYLEIRSTPPRLGRLRELLSSCPFKGNEFELECLHAQTHKYTLEDLLDKCQASRQELLNALNAMRAVAIDGFWRMLDFQYTIRCVNQVLQLIDDNSWNWRRFPFEETLDTLCVLEPRLILEIILTDWFAERIPNVFAEMIMRSADRMHYQEFSEAWAQSVPNGIKTDAEYLKGLALICDGTIKYFPENSLPDSIAERFSALFNGKEQWSIDEIQPYMENLIGKGENLSSVLLKYARCITTVNGKKMYCRR